MAFEYRMTLVCSWSLVFATNLFVPLLLAMSITERGGRLGMSCVILAYWFLGVVACARGWRFGLAMLVGGILVSASQLLPVLQLVAGMLSLMAWSPPTGDTGEWMYKLRLSEIGGLAVTALTGGILMALACVSGYCILGAIYTWNSVFGNKECQS